MKIYKKVGLGLAFLSVLAVFGFGTKQALAAPVTEASFNDAQYVITSFSNDRPKTIEVTIAGEKFIFTDKNTGDTDINLKTPFSIGETTFLCGQGRESDGITLTGSPQPLPGGGTYRTGYVSLSYKDDTTEKCTNNVNNVERLDKLAIAAVFGVPGVGGGGTTPPESSAGCVLETSLEWILCPVITGLSKSADKINDLVIGQLNFNVNENLGNSVRNAWSVFRTLASAIIIIVLLVMVISQAVGGGLFEAYTIRKLLPRLVAAIIIMQISWELCKWLITLSNDAGQGIGQLLAAPFGGTGKLDLPSLLQRLSGVWAGIVSVGATGGLITAALFSGAIIGFGWPILLLVAISVIMALVVAVATLLFRNALIILLVILSPLAFLAFILPGTDKYWKIWRDNFTRVLIFFPLVIAMIYAGRIFAWTAGNLGEPGPLDIIMVFVGFFGPYFLLPKSFKWGGTLLASVSRGINEAWPVKKGREVAKRELLSGEDSAMKRRLGHWAADYTDVDENGNKLPLWQRTKSSVLAGRFIPTERAKGSMVARGNAFKSKENDLKQAIASRRREKAAARTDDVGVGKQMDMNTFENAMNGIAEEQRKRNPNQYRIKDLEREAKEAARDLIATGSTLELNGMTVNEVGVDGKMRTTHIWKTKLWRDLLNGAPDLYREVKGQAPDWVPHRTPTGLPKFRGEGTTPNPFLQNAAGHPEYVEDVQWAESLHTTVEELDAGSMARVHPTYFERIGDAAKKGNEIYRRGVATNDDSLKAVGQQLLKPAQEFGRTVERLASQQGGRQQLAAMMGGADTMEHLDYGLQFSGLTDNDGNPLVKVNAPKGQGSLEAVLDFGARREAEKIQITASPSTPTAAAAPATTPASASQPSAATPPSAAPAAGGVSTGRGTGVGEANTVYLHPAGAGQEGGGEAAEAMRQAAAAMTEASENIRRSAVAQAQTARRLGPIINQASQPGDVVSPNNQEDEDNT